MAQELAQVRRILLHCTSNGRKISELVGGSGHGLAGILDDDVIRSKADPRYVESTILADEFAHTVHKHGLSHSIKIQYIRMKLNGKLAASLSTVLQLFLINVVTCNIATPFD